MFLQSECRRTFGSDVLISTGDVMPAAFFCGRKKADSREKYQRHSKKEQQE
jgi:hypothetical protein